MSHNTPERTQKLIGLAIVVFPLVGAIIACVLLWNKIFFAKDLWIMLGLYVATTMGVTIGYHRMLTHEGFHAPNWIRGVFVILGCMAWEGSPLDWSATHVKHHAHSDEEGDPHSPLEGFWHAHLGWLFSPTSFADPKIYVPQLLEDKTIMFVERYTNLWMALALIIPFALGGWTGLLWGGVVRIFLTTHVTWSVNSICHMFGKRAFETTDESRNEWIIGLLGFGEGWHNNHHAFPRNAFHGMRWYQVDLSGLLIRILERLGLVWDVQRVSKEAADAHRVRTQSMQEHVRELRTQLAVSIAKAKEDLMILIERYAKPPVTIDQLLDVTKSCEESVQRLNEIQERMTAATHLKKQKMMAYLSEVQRLADEAKAKAARLVAQPS